MEGDPESSLNASGGDHPCDTETPRAVTRRVRIPPKEIKKNFGRAQGIPAHLPTIREVIYRKAFIQNDLCTSFSPKAEAKPHSQCRKMGC